MDRQAIIVTDISYGDAGKGTAVDYLVRQVDSAVVVRHNGGSQAAHNVITPDGRWHTFAQFGSGSFVPGVRTHLSRYMLVNPLNMLLEADHLVTLGVTDIWSRTTVDATATIILPWHQAANQWRECARGIARHGSCGQGIGEAQIDNLYHPERVIRAGDLRRPYALQSKLAELCAVKYRELLEELGTPSMGMAEEWAVLTDPSFVAWLCSMYDRWRKLVRIVEGDYLQVLADAHDLLVFEGAQGVLLDEDYGFHPYTTWSHTTPVNALTLLSELHYDEPITRLGVMRAYTTRHGAGPFVTEDPTLAGSLTEYHNGVDAWQGSFRYGHLDLIAHKYAIQACQGLDGLMVTGLDRMATLAEWRYCVGYQRQGTQPADATDYFRVAGDGTLSDMHLDSPGDLDRQARLGELLFTSSPVYCTVNAPGGTADVRACERKLINVIEENLGLRVSITSYGPTAADKRSLITY